MVKGQLRRGNGRGKAGGSDVPPSTDRAAAPDFDRMPPEAFEGLTRALLDKEPGVTRADLYHTRFDAQYGIDAFAETPDGLIVASSKRYQRIGKGDMARWSHDFLDHWDSHWRTQNVRKFVLVTAAPTHHRNRLADIAVERARFKPYSVEYDVWSPNQLLERLRGHRGLVSHYLGYYWVEPLCGVQPPEASEETVRALADIGRDDELAALEAALIEGVAQRVQAAAHRIDRGHAQAVAEEVEALRAHLMWARLPAALKARIVRLQGSVALNAGDVDAAERFAAEADALASGEEPRLHASIALRRQGVAAALAALGAPTTENGRAFRAGLLFASGDSAGALALVEQLTEGNPEKHRLKGYGALLDRDLDRAQAELEAALSLAADSVPVRRTAAMVSYARALSPLAPLENLHYPTPVNVAFVRQDDEARELLAQAYDAFTGLGADAGPVAQDLDQVWRLACLGNLRDRSKAAAELARSLLNANPRNVLAIGWSRARGLDVDLAPSRLALRTALFGGDIDENEVHALEWLTDEAGAAALAPDLDGLLARGGWSPEIEAELRALQGRLTGDPGDDVDVGAIAVNDVPRLTAALERLVERNAPDPLILGLGEALAAAEAWPAIVPALALLEAFDTADALRLAAFAAFHGGDLVRAQDILRRAVSRFPGARLPVDLRRLEAQVLIKTGQPQEALAQAAGLAAETEAVRDRLLEARLRVEIGDLRAAAGILDALLDGKALDAHTALAWSDKLATDARETATALWRFATAEPLADEMAMQAYHLSFALGLEHEHPELAEAAGRLAQKEGSGVEIVDLEGIKDMVSRDRERLEQIDKLWTGGLAPVHAVAAAARVSLAELLHLDSDEADRLRPVFLRSGAPGEASLGGPLGSGRLLMDLTALLVADQLDLLDLIERLTEPHIGASTIEALLAIEERVRHPQPRRVQSARAIIDQVGRGISLLPPANALRVTHEPIDGEVGIQRVIEVLSASSDDPLPPDMAGQPLLFCELTLSEVAEDDLLPTLLDRFDVFLAPESLEMARDELERADRGTVLLAWISRLRDRLSAGLAAGRYHALPGLAVENESVADDQPASRNLLELLRAGEADDGRIWIDDRAVSSFTHFGSARVMGTYDVLGLLLQHGRLDDAAYYDKLLRLRAGGGLFLPLSAEEVLRYLARAEVIEGEVQETRELRILRRSVGLCLRHQDQLRLRQAPGPIGERPIELPFAMALRSLLKECVVEQWSANVPVATARAKSDWLWRALRSEHVPLVEDAPQRPDSVFFAPLNLGELISGGVLIGRAGGDTAFARRAAYLQWVADVVGIRFDRDPALAREAAQYARVLFRADKQGGRKLKRRERAKWRQLVGLAVKQLPTPLMEAVASDKTFLRDLGLDETGVVTVADMHFSGAEFWRAITMSLASGDAEAKEIDGTKRAFRHQTDAVDGFAIQIGDAVSLVESVLGLLSPDPMVRAETLEKELAELDVPAGERDDVRAEVAAAETPDHIIRIIEDLRTRSIPRFLRKLVERIGRGNTPRASFEPPPVTDWLRYLRWTPEPDPLAATAEQLTREVGAAEAARRLSALPIALPDVLARAIEGFDADGMTFMARVHRLRVCRLALPAEGAELAADVEAVAKAGVEQGATFVAALRWAARSFEYHEGWSDLSPTEKHVTVWTFADRLTAVAITSNTNLTRFAEWLNEQARDTAVYRMMELQSGYDDSILRAGAMNERGIILAGLEYALGEAADHLQLSPTQLAQLGDAIAAADDDGVLHPPPERAQSEPVPFDTWLVRPTPDLVMNGAGNIEPALVEVVSNLAADPYVLGNWTFLLAYGRPALSSSLRAALEPILLDLDLARLIEGQEDPDRALREVSEVSARLVSARASDAVLNGLLVLSKTWLGQTGEATFEARLHALIEAAAAASRSYEGTGRLRLSRFLTALFGARPEAAGATRPILDQLVDLTPVREARPFWRALVAARTY